MRTTLDNARYSTGPGTRDRLKNPEITKAAGCHPTAFDFAEHVVNATKPSADTRVVDGGGERLAPAGASHRTVRAP